MNKRNFFKVFVAALSFKTFFAKAEEVNHEKELAKVDKLVQNVKKYEAILTPLEKYKNGENIILGWREI